MAPSDPVNGAQILPGTSFPHQQPPPPGQDPSTTTSPVTFPGPHLNNEPTICTLYNPSQLATLPSAFHKAFQAMVNAAFCKTHSATQTLPAGVDRLRHASQFLTELGNAEGTFTLVITPSASPPPSKDADQDYQILATASGKRYRGANPVKVAAAASQQDEDAAAKSKEEPRHVFSRNRPATPGVQEWELSLMAVDPPLHGQGCAGFLMKTIEARILQKFRAGQTNGVVGPEAVADAEEDGVGRGEKEGLVMLLTSIKEINGGFYGRRGWVEDYETRHPEGFYGSPRGFCVVHMSRQLV